MTTDAQTFHGEETFAASPDLVFSALTDLDPQGALVKSIPDLVSAERIDERTLRCKVKPGFSFLRATMKLTIEMGEVDLSRRATAMRITSTGIGASMTIDCRMAVHEQGSVAEPVPEPSSVPAVPSPPDNGQTRIGWEARVLSRTGLLAAVSPTLIRGAAEQVIRHGWEAMRRHLET